MRALIPVLAALFLLGCKDDIPQDRWMVVEYQFNGRVNTCWITEDRTVINSKIYFHPTSNKQVKIDFPTGSYAIIKIRHKGNVLADELLGIKVENCLNGAYVIDQAGIAQR